MASIQFRSVRKSFRSTEILHGLDFDVQSGEFVALVGPSGCGKSTLLRLLAGLEDLTDGTIAIGGRVMNDVAPKDRDIAMVFQSYALYPNMNVAANMGFALRMQRQSPEAIAERVDRAAAILNLDKLLHRFPRELSGGQRQRVAMGRAIVRDPKVFLFDEPLSNLDAKLRVSMRAEIRALHQRLGTTTVYVTHDQVEAMTMADRIVVMRDGIIEQIGSPLALYDHPVNTFVAQFIGSPSMNLLAGVVGDDGKGGPALLQDGSAWPLPAGGRFRPGDTLTYGIRPEHLRLCAPGQGALRATVEVVEPSGAQTELVLRVGQGTTVNAFVHGRVGAVAGDEVGLDVDRERVHLFEPSTEACLA